MGPSESKEKNWTVPDRTKESLPPTELALPANQDIAARYHPSRTTSEAGEQRKYERTMLTRFFWGGWFPCSWLQRKVIMARQSRSGEAERSGRSDDACMARALLDLFDSILQTKPMPL